MSGDANAANGKAGADRRHPVTCLPLLLGQLLRSPLSGRAQSWPADLLRRIDDGFYQVVSFFVHELECFFHGVEAVEAMGDDAG